MCSSTSSLPNNFTGRRWGICSYVDAVSLLAAVTKLLRLVR